MPKIRISSLTGTTGQSPAHFRLFNSAGITAAIGLAALPVFLTLAPMFGTSEANAEPSTIGAAATIVPNLSLSAQNVSMVMTPTGSGTVFKTASVDATVSTNNETGYTLYFSDKDDNTSLKHANLADKAITSTENTLSGNDMLPNTWGYTLSAPAPEGETEINNTTNLGLTYNSIPADYTTINSSDTLTEGETSKLTFGVKINNGIPSGTYSDEILISAVINYSSTGYDQNQLWLGADGKQIETMQEMTPAVCASVPTPTASAIGSNIPTTTLTDTRNNEIYTVKKLADGNCWMTESLKLGSTTEDMILTPEKSNVATNFTLHTAETAANQPTNNYDTDYVFTGNSKNNNTYLYNWYAATAGSGTQSLTAGQTASQDVCPKGWHLPNNEGNASWNRLLRVGQGVYEIATSADRYADPAKVAWGKFTGGIGTASTNPLGLQVTGNFLSGPMNSTGSGYYWSRTAQSDIYAYDLYFGNGYVFPQSYGYKQYGFAVRCVASDESEYMQNWTGCSDLLESKSVILYDNRDEKKYTVAKQKDGKCWTTQNLTISGVTLTPDDTHVTSNYDLPASGAYDFSSESNLASVNGSFYSWKAATAGSEMSGSGNATQDICPKGWHLPTSSEYQTLVDRNIPAGTNMPWSASEAPFKGSRGGFVMSNHSGTADNIGFLWTSTSSSSDIAYYMFFDSTYSQVTDGTSVLKGFGLNVRCVYGS